MSTIKIITDEKEIVQKVQYQVELIDTDTKNIYLYKVHKLYDNKVDLIWSRDNINRSEEIVNAIEEAVYKLWNTSKS